MKLFACMANIEGTSTRYERAVGGTAKLGSYNIYRGILAGAGTNARAALLPRRGRH
jgi:hypothetical protein